MTDDPRGFRRLYAGFLQAFERPKPVFGRSSSPRVRRNCWKPDGNRPFSKGPLPAQLGGHRHGVDRGEVVGGEDRGDVVALGGIMLASARWEIPETITGLIGEALIGLSLW